MNFFVEHPVGRWLHGTPDEEEERKLDEQLENSFPASDPPPYTRTPIVHGSLHALKSAWNRTVRGQ